jgi:hypothetical protein
MAVCVVYVFETVEVNEIQGNVSAGRWQCVQCSLKPFDQTRTVGESSQHIMMGKELNTPVSLLLLASASIPGDRWNEKTKTSQSNATGANSESFRQSLLIDYTI